MNWVKPSQCQSFWSWLCYGWCFPSGWDGPYVKLYTSGWRFLGFESEKIVRQESE